MIQCLSAANALKRRGKTGDYAKSDSFEFPVFDLAVLPPGRPFPLPSGGGAPRVAAMTADPHRLARLLAERPYLLADGATGTNLFDMGLAAGDAPELWNVEHAERVESLHRAMLAAGADIILTNSFGGSAYRLKLHKAEARVAELNELAARIARRIADEEGREIVVAGDIGPTGELFEPLGPLSIAAGAAAFAAQARALAKGGADCIWIETMSSKDELTAAVMGAAETGLPVVCTLTFDTNGRTMMGVTPAEVALLCREQLAPRPLAYGANCGVGPAELIATLAAMAAAAGAGDVLVAKGNCGVPYYVEGKIKYDGTPEQMATYARLARDCGARIIGGCCGTTPAHLAAIRASLEGYQPGARPTLADITARLGKISAGAEQLCGHPGHGAERPARREGRRRRGEESATA
jgi:5-methyltetrahydrofolate--homocysteine methyltransferase